MKTQLVPLDIPDFEQASKVLRKAAKSGRINNSELGYITGMVLSVCLRGLNLSQQEAELLDQALGIVMVKSMD